MRPVRNLTIPITLARHVDEPLHEQIAGQVGAAIRDGLLAPRAQLPSTRSLATLLGVSRGVAIAAYEVLFAKGCVRGESGSGTFVAGHSCVKAPPPASGQRTLVDLRPGQPSTEAFPLAAWRAAWRRAGFRRPPTEAAPALGLPQLRRAISEHFLGTKGSSCHGKQIVITRGPAHGLTLVLEALGIRGPLVAIEQPCPAWLWRVAGSPTPLAVDSCGARVDEIPPGCRVAVISADAQIPYGTVLSPQRRGEVARWAHETGGFVIEIACDTVFRPELDGLPRLSAMAGARSVLIGGFDELLSPALRLGYAVVPDELAAEMASIIERRGEQPESVGQLAMESMLGDGTVVRLMHRLGRLYARKRRLVQQTLGGVVAAGTLNSAVIPLPPNANAEQVAAELFERSIRVETLAPYHFFGQHPQGLVVGYGHVPDAVLERALNTLAIVQQ